jgi:hypothetical protein
MKQTLFLLLLAMGSGVVGGCGDDGKKAGDDAGLDATDDDGGGDAAVEPVDESTEEDVEVAEGGLVELEGAELEIPADAIQSDDDTVAITMTAKTPPASLPGSDSIYGLYFEFGPEGLQFEDGVVLKLPIPDDIGDKVPVISYFNSETDEWENLPTQIVGDMVHTSIRHFSGYAVRGDDVGECTFEACAPADPSGYWVTDSLCERSSVDNNNPFSQLCASASFALTNAAQSATLSIYTEGQGQQQVKSYSLYIESDRNLTATIPTSCFVALDAETCDDLEKSVAGSYEFSGVTCTLNGNNCDCTAEDSVPTNASGTWSTAGDVLTLQGMGDNTYCVEGDSLQLYGESVVVKTTSGVDH